MSDFYWELTTHDGTAIDIPPAAVETVKKRMTDGQPINTSAMVIPANQVKSFMQTSRRFGDQRLLEDVAQAFREPIISADGVASKWVKKAVSQREYLKHHSSIPAYRKLGQEGGMVMVAFRQPTHLIDVNQVDYCDDNEISQLTTRQ